LHIALISVSCLLETQYLIEPPLIGLQGGPIQRTPDLPTFAPRLYDPGPAQASQVPGDQRLAEV